MTIAPEAPAIPKPVTFLELETTGLTVVGEHGQAPAAGADPAPAAGPRQTEG